MNQDKAKPIKIEGDSEYVWTTVFLAETCRASDACGYERVDRAEDLAEVATEVYLRRMAIGREAENDANNDCRGVQQFPLTQKTAGNWGFERPAFANRRSEQVFSRCR